MLLYKYKTNRKKRVQNKIIKRKGETKQMQKLIFYIGTNDKDTYKKELDDKTFLAVIDTCFNNYTLETVTGVYTMQDGSNERVCEQTFKVTVLNTDASWSDSKISNICKFLKNMLNQESIALEIHNNVSISFM